jgi:hypothetical protein
MAVSNVVETIVKLRGSREFQHEARDTAKSVLGIGDSTEKAGKKAGMGWKGVAKWAGGTAALYSAGSYLKSAVSSTEDLAKNTMLLSRATGLDTKTASAWSELLKVRGIDTKKFQVGMVKLSKTMEAARGGNKKASATLQDLGVSYEAIATGDVDRVLMQSADAFSKMTNPAEKAAAAQTLFGKAGSTLLPMLQGGSTALNEQIAMVDKYGATIEDTAGAKEMIARQREMKLAMDGLKITLGTALMPAIESFVGVLLKVVQALSPILRNSTALYIILGLLTTAFTVLKVATMVATIQAVEFNFALLLIPLAIVAIVAGIIALYFKWKWFHNAVNNTFAWIKKNWPLLVAILTGPIGAAVILIVKNFDKIKAGFVGAMNWIIDRLNSVLGFINKAVGVFNRLPGPDIGKVGMIGHMAAGGPVQRTGPYLVGERGPELVSLQRGSHVFPNSAVASGLPPLDSIGAGGTIVTKVYLDKRQIAEAVGRYSADKKARQ